MGNQILNYWLNGRSINWISAKTGKSIDQVHQALREVWNGL